MLKTYLELTALPAYTHDKYFKQTEKKKKRGFVLSCANNTPHCFSKAGWLLETIVAFDFNCGWLEGFVLSGKISNHVRMTAWKMHLTSVKVTSETQDHIALREM